MIIIDDIRLVIEIMRTIGFDWFGGWTYRAVKLKPLGYGVIRGWIVHQRFQGAFTGKVNYADWILLVV